MMTVYTTYFESTKTDSNEFTGALGLGAKSPFCYTSNFTVTSIKNGLKSIYTAFIDDTSVPTLVLTDQSNTDESDGLEVKFQVEEKDFSTFEEEALKILPWLDISPKVNTSLKYTHYSDVYTPVDGCEDVLSSTQFHPYGKGYALMGNVLYLIDEYALYPEGYEYFTEKELLKKFLFRFDIGELDIQASREALSYIPSTIQAIKDKVNKLKDTLINKLGRRYEELNKDVILLRYLDFNPIVNVIWKDFLQKFNIQDFKQNINIYSKDLKKFNLVWDTYISAIKTPEKYQKTPIQERVCPIQEMLTPYTIFYINDQSRTTKVYSVFAEHLKNPTYRQYTTEIITKHNAKPKGLVLRPLDLTKPIDLDGFKKFYCIPDYLCFTVSELDPKTKVSIKSFKKKVSNVPSIHINTYSRIHRRLVDNNLNTLLKKKDTRFYLPESTLRNNNIVLEGFEEFPSYLTIKSVLTNIDYSNLIPDSRNYPIYFIPDEHIHLVKDLPNWVNLNNALIKAVKELVKTHSHVVAFNKAKSNRDNCFNPGYYKDIFIKGIMFTKSPLVKLIKPYLKEYANLNKMGFNTRTSDLLDKYMELKKQSQTSKIQSLVKKYKEVIEKYPMLFTDVYGSGYTQKNISTYIQAIDLFYNNQHNQ